MSFFKSKSFKFLMWVIIFILLVGGSVFAWKYYRLKKQEKAAAEISNPVIEKLRKQSKTDKNEYDLEATIRIINGLDEAMNHTDNFEDYMMYMSRQDYSKVAPEVIAARLKILELTSKIYATQINLKDQESMWKLTKEITSISLNSASTIASSTMTFGSAGREGVKGIQQSFNELRKRDELTSNLKNELMKHQYELSNYMFDYSEVYYKYMSEWDRVCVNRDRAYLAINAMQFDEALASTNASLAQNPDDKESQLLKAICLIENNKEIISAEHPGEDPGVLLDNYIKEYPGESAPALLLKGVFENKRGNFKEAKLAFEQSAAYYPKQSEKLTDMLNPYQMRSYLKKSREGNYIVDLYKSMMLGSGYFSPDLQMARNYFQLGDFENGKAKVLDHFSRRRNQAQWDNILSDIEFCRNLMEKDFTKIFPEQSFLNLSADVSTFGDKLNVSVKNNSNRKLTNVSLILCLQFTDMHRDDYSAFKMEKTLPALEPNKTNDFGKLEIKYDLFGKKKTSSDIVSYRAVLISNEAISWLDNDEFRLKEILEGDTGAHLKNEKQNYLAAFGLSDISLKNDIIKGATAEFSESLYGLATDDLKISLPKNLSVLKPVFRLKGDNGKEIAPEKNVLGADKINLSFSKDNKNSKSLTLSLYSKYMNADIQFERDAGGKMKIKNVSLK